MNDHGIIDELSQKVADLRADVRTLSEEADLARDRDADLNTRLSLLEESQEVKKQVSAVARGARNSLSALPQNRYGSVTVPDKLDAEEELHRAWNAMTRALRQLEEYRVDAAIETLNEALDD